MRLQRTGSIILLVVFAIAVHSGACTAQEYAGWVIDPQAIQGIKRVLVAWNKGNACYSAAQQAVRYFDEHELNNVQVSLWDGEPFDFGAFDAVVVIEAFSLNDSGKSSRLYTKDERIPFGPPSPDTYSPATASASVEAAWVTLYLLRVESYPLRLGDSPISRPTPRQLGPIVYINSDGGGWFIFSDPLDPLGSLAKVVRKPADIKTSLSSATKSLVDSFVEDMKSIDPTNW